MENPGEFELELLTRGEPPGAPVGPQPLSANVHVLSTIEEFREAVVTVAASAQRLISIYTPDLEPDLYDQTPFLDVVKRLVLARSFGKVRVLLKDSSRLIRDGNRFVAMGRRLTSYIDVRIIEQESRQRASAYLIADDRGIVYRASTEQWDGVADYNNPAVAKLYLVEFDETWHANTPHHLLRTAYR